MIGAAPEYFKACLALGIRRLSMPIEGFGERVRNKVFNKSLTFEQIKTAFKSAFEAGLMEIKIGMVLSGHETQEDFDNAAEEFEELYRMKEEAQSGMGMRSNICTTLDTQLITDKGLKEAGEVEVGDRDLIGGKILEVFDNGVKVIYGIEMETGQVLRGTANHPVLTEEDSWRYLSKIRVGDRVRLPYGVVDDGLERDLYLDLSTNRGWEGKKRNICSKDFWKIKEEEAFVIGWLVGDGHVGENVSYWLFKDNEADIESKVVKLLMDMNYRISVKFDNLQGVRIKRVAVFSKQLVYSLKKIGVGKGKDQRVPKAIRKSNLKVQKVFLNSLFSADGSVSYIQESKSRSIRLKSAAPQLLRDVQIMLQSMGIPSAITGRELGVRKNFQDLFLKEVGIAGKKGEFAVSCDIKDCRSDGSSRYYKDYFVSRVRKVWKEEKQKTIGFRTETKQYSTNGVWSHNTPLVLYPSTGLGWAQQNTSNISLKELKLMKPFLERLRGKVRFKFNGQHFGTFIEQATLNLGRLGTPIWEKIADFGYAYYSSPTKEVVQMFLDGLKERDLSLQKFLEEKPFDHIFPMDMVEKKSRGYSKLIFNSVGKKELSPCTKTVIRENPKCYNCGYCSTQEMKDSILKREIFNERSSVDIQEAIFKNKAQGAYRVGFKVNSDYSMIGKESLAFVIASKFLQESEVLFKNYHSSHSISNSQMLRGNMWDWMSGNFFFDMHFKSKSVNVDWNDLIVKVNSKLRSSSVFSVQPVEVKDRVSENIQVISILNVEGIHLHVLSEAVKNRKLVVKVGAKGRVTGNDIKLEDRDLPYCDIQLAQTKQGVRVALTHPIWMNPYLWLSSNTTLSYKKAMEKSKLYIVGYFGEKAGICKCGNSTRISEISRSEAPLCSICLSQKYLTHLISI